MAVVKMKKLTLIGYGAQKDEMLDLLHRTGEVEIIPTLELEACDKANLTADKDLLKDRLSRIDSALQFVSEQKRRVKALDKQTDKKTEFGDKKGLFASAPILTWEEYNSVKDDEGRLLTILSEIEGYSKRLGELKSIIQRTNARIDSVTPFLNVDFPLSSLKDTVYTTSIVGTIASNKLEALSSYLDSIDTVEYTTYDGEPSVVVMVLLKELKDEVLAKLQSLEFYQVKPDFIGTAREEIDRLKSQILDAQAEEDDIAYAVVEYTHSSGALKVLYDYYSVHYEMNEVKEGFSNTRYAYVLSGWVREDREEYLTKTLSDSYLVYEATFSEPEADDQVPTALKNNAFVSSYESITNMFSPPNYREKDPNPIMSIFYFIFFGLMVSDAGYGFLLALSGFLAMRFIKTRDGGKMFRIIAFGGVSTFIWGALFNSFFGVALLPVTVLFNPLSDPLSMFILALVVGVVQIMVGILLNGIGLVSKGKIVDAICDSLSWLLVFTGLILYIVGMMGQAIVGEVVAKAFGDVGLIVVLVGVAIIILFGGRKKPNIIGKAIGGLGALYGIVNYVADIFSYARLFGLGLATGAICMVFNEMAGIIINLIPGVGIVAAVLVLIVGHVFNMAINTLGAYVHNNRLQFVEFFGKFYEGDGRLFRPLGSETKYIQIKK